MEDQIAALGLRYEGTYFNKTSSLKTPVNREDIKMYVSRWEGSSGDGG